MTALLPPGAAPTEASPQKAKRQTPLTHIHLGGKIVIDGVAQPLNEIKVTAPPFSVIVGLQATHQQVRSDRMKVTYLCAAAVGIVWDDKRMSIPDYEKTGDIIAYGTRIIDRVVGLGAVSPLRLENIGIVVLNWLFGLLPIDEVQEAVDFTTPPPVALS